MLKTKTWTNDFWRVIGSHAKLERIATGFQFLEGPLWHPYDRHLTFSDIPGNRLYRWNGQDGVTVLRNPSHMANGNTYDHQGRLLTCEHATSRVTRTGQTGRIEVLASHYGDLELNSPNDIVVRSDGGIYFTDPTWGRVAGFGVPRAQQLAFQGIYRLDPDDLSLTLLVDDFSQPNGLCFSLDEKRLFVDDTIRGHIRAFDVHEDGTLSGGGVWAVLENLGAGAVDGMKLDRQGNLYCAAPGGVHLFDAGARCLGVVLMPEHTSNMAWGDDDLRSLYITASLSLYRLRVEVPGRAAF